MPRIKKQWVLLGLCVLLPIGYRQATYTNYGRLEALLATHQWQEADRQTTEIILRESNWWASTWKMWGVALLSGKLTGWYEPIKQYSCHDLERLDNLWLKYSHERFGLSVQQQIFERIAAQSKDEFRTYDAFIDEVAWDRPDNLSDTSIGHFPSKDWVQATTYGKGDPWMLSAVYMYDRIEECQISQQSPLRQTGHANKQPYR
jgi:GUN4-like